MKEWKYEIETSILSTKGEQAGILLFPALWRRKSKIIVMGRDRSVGNDDGLRQA